MFRIRAISDAVAPIDRAAIREAQEILRAQFSAMPASDIDKLPDQLRDPLTYRFVSRLLVAEDSRDRVRGVAVLLYAPDLGFCYLETISAAPGRTGGGLGGALYDRVREKALTLGATGLYLECLPDDPALSPDPATRAENENRLRFYERYGARPIIGTAYETPLTPGGSDPPYLVFDGLDQFPPPARDTARGIVRAILERKYGAICPPAYVEMVVASIADDPVRLRPFRYLKREPQPRLPARGTEPFPMVVNEAHDIHHMRDRGYVEAPVRVSAILAGIEPTGLFRRVPAQHHGERFIRAVHDGRLVDYLERTCRTVPPGRSVYPYVFPVRNAARPPREASVRAGYFCIDTFTPLNENAFKAARGAVDCTLTAADLVLGGARMAYALVRPPGHHAERRAFGGFCYFSNAAIAAQFLSRYGKVAILDIDYHHGNGQQDVFYDRGDVLTVSIHGHPRFAYPYFSGFEDETGVGAGAGANFNLPLPETITADQYRSTLQRALRRVARHDPAFLVLALGFDTGRGDPTGTWPHRPADFEILGRMIGAEGYATVVVQEGGYRIRTLGANARNFFTGLAAALRAATPGRRAITARARARDRDIPEIAWRDTVRESDVASVRVLVAATGAFTTAEVDIAGELAAEAVEKGPPSGYAFIFASAGERLAGYACYGPVPGTDDRFDLYWIAVDPDRRRQGLGRAVLERTEAAIRSAGGRRIYVDTSDRDAYAAARRFYRAAGYRKVAGLADFYRPGDGKVILMKDLSS